MDFFERNWFRLKYKMINILNYLDYEKEKAMNILQEELG